MLAFLPPSWTIHSHGMPSLPLRRLFLFLILTVGMSSRLPPEVVCFRLNSSDACGATNCSSVGIVSFPQCLSQESFWPYLMIDVCFAPPSPSPSQTPPDFPPPSPSTPSASCAPINGIISSSLPLPLAILLFPLFSYWGYGSWGWDLEANDRWASKSHGSRTFSIRLWL